MKKSILTAFVFVIGAVMTVHAAKVRVNGPAARQMWEALNIMAKLQDLPLHVFEGNSDTLAVRSLDCAAESVEACAFFVTVNGVEKMIVETDAASKIIDALYANGIYPSNNDPSQSAASVSCSKTNDYYECDIVE